MCFKKFISLVRFRKKEDEELPKVITWENDCLNYKQAASRFSTVIKTIDQSFSIVSLEGYDKWGKTFFERMGKGSRAAK